MILWWYFLMYHEHGFIQRLYLLSIAPTWIDVENFHSSESVMLLFLDLLSENLVRDHCDSISYEIFTYTSFKTATPPQDWPWVSRVFYNGGTRLVRNWICDLSSKDKRNQLLSGYVSQLCLILQKKSRQEDEDSKHTGYIFTCVLSWSSIWAFGLRKLGLTWTDIDC